MKAPRQAGMVIKIKKSLHGACLRANAKGGKGLLFADFGRFVGWKTGV